MWIMAMLINRIHMKYTCNQTNLNYKLNDQINNKYRNNYNRNNRNRKRLLGKITECKADLNKLQNIHTTTDSENLKKQKLLDKIRTLYSKNNKKDDNNELKACEVLSNSIPQIESFLQASNGPKGCYRKGNNILYNPNSSAPPFKGTTPITISENSNDQCNNLRDVLNLPESSHFFETPDSGPNGCYIYDKNLHFNSGNRSTNLKNTISINLPDTLWKQKSINNNNIKLDHDEHLLKLLS